MGFFVLLLVIIGVIVIISVSGGGHSSCSNSSGYIRDYDEDYEDYEKEVFGNDNAVASDHDGWGTTKL